MYSRHVSCNLKPIKREELTQMFDREILPLLQKQNGFHEEIVSLTRMAGTSWPPAYGKARKTRKPTAARPIPRCSRR